MRQATSYDLIVTTKNQTGTNFLTTSKKFVAEYVDKIIAARAMISPNKFLEIMEIEGTYCKLRMMFIDDKMTIGKRE